ncbi:MAG: hypothetical protein IPJ19_13955 [Planctomycetes bacterium]|nr:hypothetical protein [Planctomycetota bacterium]
MFPRPRICALILATSLVPACRNASSDGSSNGAPTLTPSTLGASGCVGPNQVFTAPQAPVAVPLATLVPGAYSQLTAAQGAELLYATGQDATVVAIDVSGASPVETELVGAGAVAFLLSLSGLSGTPELSGVAVLDATHLVLVEHDSNTLITCDRTNVNTLGIYAGLPDETPGFADGLAASARFSFGAPTQLATTNESEPSVLVADVGNHALRLVSTQNGVSVVSTLAGTGTAGASNGSVAFAAFDTPCGVTLGCSQSVILSERGDNGAGQRLRSVTISGPNPFGGWFGSVATVAGSGTQGTTEGPAASAELDTPLSPLSTSAGELYWIDAGTGVLRRKQADGTCDCPLSVDCATAVTTPNFPAGHLYSLTQTSSGVLYVLDGTDGVLWRVTP